MGLIFVTGLVAAVLKFRVGQGLQKMCHFVALHIKEQEGRQLAYTATDAP